MQAVPVWARASLVCVPSAQEAELLLLDGKKNIVVVADNLLDESTFQAAERDRCVRHQVSRDLDLDPGRIVAAE